MVDITGKPKVYREATATGRIRLKPETIKLIKNGK
ncbi:MAG: cyclic pyranopterin monophosphate synthase MoaC, partial [Candidatus Bathyarchaeia archaeon]